MPLEKGPVRFISYGFTLMRRVCRSTLSAATYVLQAGVEESMRICVVMTDVRKELSVADWESPAAGHMREIHCAEEPR